MFGVNLFFVLSGFLISGILLKEKIANEGHQGRTIKVFYIRRFLRIVPIYYLVIFIAYALNPGVREYIWYYVGYSSNILPAKVLFDSPLVHTWSLAIEEQFYLIWPWLLIFVNRKYIKHVLLGFILIGIATRWAVYTYHWPMMVFNCFDSFGLGALYAYVRMDKDRCARFENVFKKLFPLLLFIAWRMYAYRGLPMAMVFSSTVDSLVGVALIMFAVNNRSEWMRKHILENKVFNFIGKISYGLYLYHYILGVYFDWYYRAYVKMHPGLPHLVTGFYFPYFVKYVLLLLISYLSFRFIEQPLLGLKKRFEYEK